MGDTVGKVVETLITIVIAVSASAAVWLIANLIVAQGRNHWTRFATLRLGIGGLLSGLCFALFFWSRFLGGTAGWLEVILFLAGVIFVAMEFFVIPGFGLAGLSGLALVIASVLMASQHFILPANQLELSVTRGASGLRASPRIAEEGVLGPSR